MNSIQPKRSNKKIIALSCVVVILIIVAGVAGYYALSEHNKRVAIEKYGSASTTPNSNTPSSDDNVSGGSTSSPKDDGETDGSDSTTPGEAKPSTPTGTFVSNHAPNLSGSPRPSSMNSTCTTTQGVTCYIEFKKGSTTKTLPAHTTDANGNTVWNWNLADIGLSEGTWTITAVAKNGSQTSSATDPTNLEVGS